MIASIQPLAKLHFGPGTVEPRTYRLEDFTTTIYPKLPSGQSIRVVIIRRAIFTNRGTAFHICRNAGKWSHRIDYAHKDQTTRMSRTQFISELKRMGVPPMMSVELLIRRTTI